MHLVASDSRSLACLLSQTALGGNALCSVIDQDSPEHALLAVLIVCRKLLANALTEALNERNGNFSRAKQRIRRSARRHLERANSSRFTLENNVTHEAEIRAVLREHRHANPQHAIVPVDPHRLAGSLVGCLGLRANDHAAIDHVVAVVGHEQVFPVEHHGGVRALHDNAHETLVMRVEHACAHLADLSRGFRVFFARLAAHNAQPDELFRAQQFAGH